MATNFGKLNFSVSFNPTTAFPLDARCYFESLEDAEAAAATAEETGSSNTIYFFGETVVVFEDGKATLYIIQPNSEGTGGVLGPIASDDFTVLDGNTDWTD